MTSNHPGIRAPLRDQPDTLLHRVLCATPIAACAGFLALGLLSYIFSPCSTAFSLFGRYGVGLAADRGNGIAILGKPDVFSPSDPGSVPDCRGVALKFLRFERIPTAFRLHRHPGDQLFGAIVKESSAHGEFMALQMSPWVPAALFGAAWLLLWLHRQCGWMNIVRELVHPSGDARGDRRFVRYVRRGALLTLITLGAALPLAWLLLPAFDDFETAPGDAPGIRIHWSSFLSYRLNVALNRTRLSINQSPVPPHSLSVTLHVPKSASSTCDASYLFGPIRLRAWVRQHNVFYSGFAPHWEHVENRSVGVDRCLYSLTLPWWMVVSIFGALLAWPAVAFFRGPVARARRPASGKCAACGYDLRGLPSPRCPECGWSA